MRYNAVRIVMKGRSCERIARYICIYNWCLSTPKYRTKPDTSFVYISELVVNSFCSFFSASCIKTLPTVDGFHSYSPKYLAIWTASAMKPLDVNFGVSFNLQFFFCPFQYLMYLFSLIFRNQPFITFFFRFLLFLLIQYGNASIFLFFEGTFFYSIYCIEVI